MFIANCRCSIAAPCTLRVAEQMNTFAEQQGERSVSCVPLANEPCAVELGPVFPSSAVQTGRYPGTRKSVDPAYKVARSGALAAETRWKDKTVIDGILGIDVSKNTLDVSISSYTKVPHQELCKYI